LVIPIRSSGRRRWRVSRGDFIRATALDAFSARAASVALSPEARKQAVDAIAFVNDPRAAEIMAKLADSAPDDVKPLAKWWATNRSTNDWKSYPAVARFVPPSSTQPTAATTRRAEDREIVLDAERPLPQRQRAITRLAADPAGVAILIDIAQEGKFPRELVDIVAERMTRNPDLGIRAPGEPVFPAQECGRATAPADQSARDDEAATRTAVGRCSTARRRRAGRCHRFNGEGSRRRAGPHRDPNQVPAPGAARQHPQPQREHRVRLRAVDREGQNRATCTRASSWPTAESVVIKESTGEQRDDRQGSDRAAQEAADVDHAGQRGARD
jgi:hypothetical protein